MSLLACLAALVAAAPAPPLRQEAPVRVDPFPPSTAIAEAVSPEALARLDELVESFVEDGEIVGGELLVIVNGRTILHTAHGFGDREASVPLETGSLFCVRSMTKPVIATAIGLLIEDDLLDTRTRVAEHLPDFDADGFRDITVEQLLQHTSGLPLSHLIGKDPGELESIQEVAALGPRHELLFEPGTAFEYSDQGTDTLTALIEVVSGSSAADFVNARVLQPLGMSASATVLLEDHPSRAIALPKYAGSPGTWGRFWSPEDPPLFSVFLGSQGLYATCVDYARFLELWKDRGRVDRQRMLSSRFVRKTLEPGPHPMRGGSGFPDLEPAYGFLMQLWMRPGDPEASGRAARDELVALGHSGSDGTYAWAFPEQDAMVLYFTQSRGNTTGLRVEEVLGELFLGAPFDPNQVAPPLEPYLGYYFEGEGDVYRAVVLDGEDLALEIPGRAIVPLDYAGEDRWKMRPNPSVVLAFDRAETGEITGYRIDDHQEHRFTPAADLPSAAEISASVRNAYRLDLLESQGPLRLTGRLTFDRADLEGELTNTYAWPDRWRIDTSAGEEYEHLAFDGEQLRYAASSFPLAPLEGLRAELLLHDNPFSRYGDWSVAFPGARTIQRLVEDDREVLVVRTGDASAPATTLYVEAATGYVRAEGSMTYVETLGRIGQRLSFNDFRDLSGTTLPFDVRITLENPMIGAIHVQLDAFEFGVELSEGTFALADLAK